MCPARHIWVRRWIYCFRQLVPKMGSSLKTSCFFLVVVPLLHVFFFKLHKCMTIIHLNISEMCFQITLVLQLWFFCILLWPPQGATFLKNAHTKTSHGQQPLVLLAGGDMPIESRCYTTITVVNKFFLLPPIIHYSLAVPQKKASRHSCLGSYSHRQLSESRHLNMINWKAAAQLLW